MKAQKGLRQPSNWEEPPPPEKNEDTGGKKWVDLRVYSTSTLVTTAREWISSGGGRDTRESEVFLTTAPNWVYSGETAETESVEATQTSICPEEFVVERGVSHVRDYRSDR